MLRKLHNHIFAVRLKELFTQSPLVLVYQTLGSIDHHGVKTHLQSSVAKQLPTDNVQIDLCYMKNSMAAATGDDTLARLFNNSNLLLGFKFPELMQHMHEQHTQQQSQQLQTAESLLAGLEKIRRDTSPAQIVGGLLQQQLPGPHIPQPALKALVEMGIRLPNEQPLVLVGAFYKCDNTPLAHLKKWIKLDTKQVYGELLAALQSPIEGVLSINDLPADMLTALDAAAGAELSGVLEYKSQAEGSRAAEQ
eukprot:GHUV01009721.1.p1 GENE.GHUV01009721.1~~GHUV01009721.1.p1  ORF type:complete len:250 (+),score=77.82 GHUV01009721.1:264-1013(+)